MNEAERWVNVWPLNRDEGHVRAQYLHYARMDSSSSGSPPIFARRRYNTLG